MCIDVHLKMVVEMLQQELDEERQFFPDSESDISDDDDREYLPWICEGVWTSSFNA